MIGVFRILRRSFGTKSNDTIKGAFLRAYGQPLQVEPLTNSPQISQPDQVKIQTQYCSLNSNDVKYLEGSNLHKLPYIPGYEFSGDIIEVGNNTELTVGQRVVGIIPERYGALSSQIILNDSDVWPLPAEVSTRDAAALVCGHSTALLAFSEIRSLSEDDTILIIAGAGGFGLAAVDIAANIFKAKVIALADTDGKAGLLRDRGAFAAFKNDLKHNYKEIMDATNNKGVKLIYDAVGGSILNTVIKCLENESDGIVLGTYLPEDLTNVSVKNKDNDNKKNKKKDEKETSISEEVIRKIKTVSLTDYRSKDQDKYYNIVEQTLQFCGDGLITAHVSQSFNLEEINDAIKYIKGKMCTGKILIEMEND